MPDANGDRPWFDSSLGAPERARLLAAELTLEEKVGLLSASYAGLPEGARPDRAVGSAAFTAGIDRVGIPDIQESDAGLGVANPGGVRADDDATALPSSLAWGASFAEAALRDAYPDAEILFDDGQDAPAAAHLAASADVAIVFAEKWSTEGLDVSDLAMPGEQDELIRVVAALAKKTIVVLEIGNPVLMPWLDDVSAVLCVWFPGSAGGPAIADLLSGAENPSGRLPITFPASVDQLPRRQLRDPETTTSNPGEPRTGPFTVDYGVEGSDVGYRWFERMNATPLFPFGFGKSYSDFEYSDGEVDGPGVDNEMVVRVTIANVSDRAGRDTPQVYVAGPSHRPKRLAGWATPYVAARQSQTVTIPLDLRAFANYSEALPGWVIEAGEYQLTLATDARSPVEVLTVTLSEIRRSPGREPI